MGRRIRVTGIKKKEPNIRLYVLALIELARQLQEQEAAQGEAAARPAGPDSGEADRD
jgi:hypothetical protein